MSLIHIITGTKPQSKTTPKTRTKRTTIKPNPRPKTKAKATTRSASYTVTPPIQQSTNPTPVPWPQNHVEFPEQDTPDDPTPTPSPMKILEGLGEREFTRKDNWPRHTLTESEWDAIHLRALNKLRVTRRNWFLIGSALMLLMNVLVYHFTTSGPNAHAHLNGYLSAIHDLKHGELGTVLPGLRNALQEAERRTQK